MRLDRLVTLVIMLMLSFIMLAPTPAAAHGSTLGEGLRLTGTNPFQGEAHLAFRINHEMRNVDLSVFDLSGRRVASLIHGPLPAGEHQVVFSARGLPLGTYFARLTTEHGVTVKRLLFSH